MLDHQEYHADRQQDADLTVYEVMQLGNDAFKVRFTVHLDTSYEFQSYAFAEVWSQDDLSWHKVCSHRPGAGNLNNKREVCYDTAITLRLLAAEVLGDDLDAD